MFNGKVVIITGASSGIGFETARHFCKLGAKITVTGRNEENLNQLLQQECAGSDTLKIIADVNVEEDRVRIINETIEKFGQIDALVNNAGILENGSIENTSLEQFDKVFNTNVRSVYHLTMLAVPHLIKTKGTIVNVSSVAGTRAFPGVLAYCMSKSAIDQFTKCIALELAPKGVRVNAVNPGVIVTDIHRRSGMDSGIYKEFLEHSKTTHALGRAGNVEEVAPVIAFLAGPNSSFITGELVHVDGGRHAMCPR